MASRSSGRVCAALGTALLLLLTSCELFSSRYEVPRWTSIAASSFHTCAIDDADRKVYCWGISPGYSSSVNVLHPDSLLPASTTPVLVPGADNFSALSFGGGNFCAIGTAARAYCAGLNPSGAVGDGTIFARRGLSEVVGGLQWKMVAAGAYHSCGLTLDGAAFCWGDQYAGKLGNGASDFVYVLSPVAVSGGHTFASIHVGGGFACGRKVSGEVWCWGVHSGIYLGVGSEVTAFSHPLPIAVHGGHAFASLTLAERHACGVTVNGEGYCWGENFAGKLGEGSTSQRGVPTRVLGGHRWASIVAGRDFTCGTTTRGAIYCWGSNERGQFGTDSPTASSVPLLVALPGKYREISVGGQHLCGIRYYRTAECWGRGDYGQLGNGDRNDSEYPVTVVR